MALLKIKMKMKIKKNDKEEKKKSSWINVAAGQMNWVTYRRRMS